MPFTSLLMSASLIAVYPAAVVAELMIVFILGRVSKLFLDILSVANFQIVDNVNHITGKIKRSLQILIIYVISHYAFYSLD